LDVSGHRVLNVVQFNEKKEKKTWEKITILLILKD
jgi:hypothetical protein